MRILPGFSRLDVLYAFLCILISTTMLSDRSTSRMLDWKMRRTGQCDHTGNADSLDMKAAGGFMNTATSPIADIVGICGSYLASRNSKTS